MLASFLRRYLLVEWLLYGLLAALLWHYGEWQPGSLIGLIIVLSLVHRLIYVIVMFALAWLYRAPRPPSMGIGWFGSIRLFLVEFIIVLALYYILQPLERWLMTQEPPSANSPTPIPVLLIHGFFCNGAYWWALRRYLRQRGLHRVYTMNMEPIMGRLNINRFAEQVEVRVEQICARTGANRVILVGHSMGGLASRVYIHRYGGYRRVAKLITLGAPHHGTRLAELFYQFGIRQMEPRNPWLAKLNIAETKPAPVPITSIYSYHDTIVAPQDSSHLTHAKNIPLAGIGHMEMAFSRRCQELVHEEIQMMEKGCCE